jgi:hypothetical protein
MPGHVSEIYNHITLLIVWEQQQKYKCVSLKYDTGQAGIVEKKTL